MCMCVNRQESRADGRYGSNPEPKTRQDRRRTVPGVRFALHGLAKDLPSTQGTASVCKALFSSKFFCKIDTVALSFVFDKNYPIMD